MKKVLSKLDPEGQGRGIIMKVTRILLLGPFYYIALYWGLYNFETHCKCQNQHITQDDLSRSANRTTNFKNPEYFVCLLIEYFFQIKVLN